MPDQIHVQKQWWRRLIDRMVPPQPDFFALLKTQSEMVTTTLRNLEYYMSTGDKVTADLVGQNEHAADTAKIANLHALNEAFSTPIDREDIYRAIEALDWIVTHCKSTINEMADLGVSPDNQMQQMTQELLMGCRSLELGFSVLHDAPLNAEDNAHQARRAHRHIERLYRHALAQLFQGEVTVEMLRKREIYHHLMDGSRYLYRAANVLQDIVVKLN